MFSAPQDNNKYRIHCFLSQSLSFPLQGRKGETLLLTPRTQIFPASRELQAASTSTSTSSTIPEPSSASTSSTITLSASASTSSTSGESTCASTSSTSAQSTSICSGLTRAKPAC